MIDLKSLNLGCGRRINTAWTNVDMTATAEGVIAADLTRGVPFGDGAFDVVYHSHVLEHIPRSGAATFLAECVRVLKPGGVLRVAVPDLENIARAYLRTLDAGEASADHDWMTLELVDQMVRTTSGGEMLHHLRQDPLPNEPFVVERLGGEATNILRWLRRPRDGARRPTPKRPWREAVIRRLLGDEYAALQIGRFRVGGEVHQWMYDRVSLRSALMGCGLRDVAVRGAAESGVEGWAGFHLDTEPDGATYKPDSLFMEGRKG